MDAQTAERFLQLEARTKKLEADNSELTARFKIMEAFFIKEFPKHFAGEAALVLATDGETLGDEKLPDMQPIDLRTEEEKERGECFHLSDLVDMGSMAG